jgi:hypothetical protein
LTTASTQKDEKQKLRLTSVPISFDFEESDAALLPIVAEWVDEFGRELVIRRSAERGPFLASIRRVPSGSDQFKIDVWGHASERIQQCLTANGRYTEDEVRYASASFLMKPFDELIEPDLVIIGEQVELHRKDLGRYIVVEGALYEACQQPHLALLENEGEFSLEARVEYFYPDHDPIAKFPMADGESVRRWLAANHPAFDNDATVAAYRCNRPDLLDDRSVEYVSYSLLHRFASGVNNLIGLLDPIKLTRMLAAISECEADLCIDADIIRDPDKRDPGLVDVNKTARDILAIAPTSALWPAFAHAEFLPGLHTQAAKLMGVIPAGTP